MKQSTLEQNLPDLDSPQQIERMVDGFYQRLLADPLMRPLFIDVAGIDLDEHLPRIRAYWQKMLLGQPGYGRHMMSLHRAVHRKAPFEPEHFDRWLQTFEHNLDQHFYGPYTERARQVARNVIKNMGAQFQGMQNND